MALVLSRKIGEGVVLEGLGVRIVVQGVRGHTVRLAFEAPKEVRIRRDELDATDLPPVKID